MARPVARQIELLQRALRPFLEAVTQSAYARRPEGEFIADFVAGNPQELALPGFVDALTRWSVPRDPDWFSYKMMDPRAMTAAAGALSRRLDMAFEPEDIFLTRGAGAGVALSLQTVVEPSDEVIFVSPPWFFHEAMIIAVGATPVRVRVKETNFDLDLDAISRALTRHTRAIIINTPHNPTGKIYPPETLKLLRPSSRMPGSAAVGRST
jgi:aspartate aminotransferase